MLKDVGGYLVIQGGGAEGDIEARLRVVRRDKVHSGPGFDMHQGDGPAPAASSVPRSVTRNSRGQSRPKAGRGFPPPAAGPPDAESPRTSARTRREGRQFFVSFFISFLTCFVVPTGFHSIRPSQERPIFHKVFINWNPHYI